MAFVLNLVPPYRDELMYSYLARLARANSVGTVANFCSFFFRENHMQKAETFASYDSPYVYNSFFHTVGSTLDRVRFFCEHSLYPYQSLFVGRYKQFWLLNRYFDDRVRFYRNIFTKLDNTVRDVRICRECREEELAEYGEYYIHRSHNLPGVYSCHKHHRPLAVYAGGKWKELCCEYEKFHPLKDGHDTSVFYDFSADDRFAVFAYQLLNAGLSCDIDGLCSAIKAKLAEMGFHARSRDKNFVDLASMMMEQGLFSVFAPKRNVEECIAETVGFLRKKIVTPRYVDPMQVASFLMFLFKDVDGIRKYLPKEDVSEEIRFLDTAKEEGYGIYEPYSPSLVMMRHADCGTVFFTTPSAFLMGWKCPLCERNTEVGDKVSELVSKASGGLYRLQSGFAGMNRKVGILHSACGHTMEVTPRGFLLEGIRCSCEHRVKAEDIKKDIEKSGEFEVVGFTDISSPILIRHKACGEVFGSTYHKFMRRPWCKKCNPAKKTDASFRKQVADLVGDEYEVVGKYVDKDTPVAIRHTACGNISKYLPRHFLDGARCPRCTKFLKEKDFKETVKNLSNGVYEVGKKETANLYRIGNTVTGASVALTKHKALQELMRPTESPILPLERDGHIGYGIRTESDADFDRLFSAYGRNPEAVVFMEDLRKAFGDKEGSWAKNFVKLLIRRKKLYRYATGIYTFTKGPWLDAGRVIYETYVVRNGKRIGMLYGKSLAYEWGVIPEKPDTLFILTDKESQEHGRAKTLYGMKVRIKGCPVPVTDKNYVLIGVLDILQMSFHFGWDWRKLKRVIQENGIMQYQFLPFLNAYNGRTRERLEELYR